MEEFDAGVGAAHGRDLSRRLAIEWQLSGCCSAPPSVSRVAASERFEESLGDIFEL
jgi:hypothetical protein